MSAYPEGDNGYSGTSSHTEDYNADDAIERMIDSARVLKKVSVSSFFHSLIYYNPREHQ